VLPVFISYARKASADAARALRDALPGQCFLDESDIEEGEKFPEHIIDALLGSRVVVLFASEAYFHRRYCLWELLAVLGPYEAQPPGTPLDHVVVVLADTESAQDLPPPLQRINWPTASKPEEAVQLVRERLDGGKATLAERYEAAGQVVSDVRAHLLELTARPPPADLSQVAVQYGLAPVSLQDDFVGRWDDLHRVDFWLRILRGEPGTAAATVTIEGLGGLGKTRLAAEYVHRLGPRHFPGGIIWIDASKELEPQFHGVLQTFDPQVPALPEFQQQKRDIRGELEKALRARAAKRPLLWVVDDIPEPVAPRPPPKLSAYCPALGQVAALMTSRRRLSLEPGRRGIPLGELGAEAGILLLKRGVSATGQLSHQDWKSIVDWVGGLPLALALLNQVLLSGESPATLLAASRSQSTTATLDRQMDALRGEVEEGSLRGVTEALSMSHERLSPAAQVAARLLAYLAPAPIPQALVDEVPGVFPLEVKRQLVARSFVTTHAGGAAVPVPMLGSVHRILADYLRTREPRPAEAWVMASMAITALLMRALQTKGQWQLLEACVPHATHVLGDRSPDDLASAEAAAHLRLSLSSALGELGRQELAVEVSGAAAEQYRRLAKEKPETFEPMLAASLNNLSNHLAGLGRREPALEVSQESVDVYRRLAKANPGQFEAPLAASVSNLSVKLSEAGRGVNPELAMESVTLYRSLARERPSAYQPDLALSLLNLSVRMGELGKQEEALEANQEAIDVYRQLPAERREAFEPELAASLNNQSIHLRALGRVKDALEAIEEAVPIYRRLAGAVPKSFEPDLAMALNNLALSLNDVGRWAEALKAIEQAVEIRRRWARARPAAFESDLAVSLANLSVHISHAGRRHEALGPSAESVEILWRLARATPGVFEPKLAAALNTFSTRLNEVGLFQEALRAIQDAIDIQRRLALREPEVFERDLAGSLTNLSNVLGSLAKRGEALGPAQESVDMFRRLARAMPAPIEPDLAAALNNLAIHLNEVGRGSEALEAIDGAIQIRRRLVAGNPEAFSLTLAGTLDIRARILNALERWDEAQAASSEAARLRSRAQH
jgi:tetratricopeptide (TPR) repeat protein